MKLTEKGSVKSTRQKESKPCLQLPESIIGNQAYLSCITRSAGEAPIQRSLLIGQEEITSKEELEELISKLKLSVWGEDFIRDFFYSEEIFSFENIDLMLNYMERTQSHIHSLSEMCDQKVYDKASANAFRVSSSKKLINPLTQQDGFNCWTAVLKAGIDAGLASEGELEIFCKSAPTANRYEDPYLLLMKDAEVFECGGKSEDEIFYFLETVPRGHIIAFSAADDHTRDGHVFLTLGGGDAMEFDKDFKGRINIYNIYRRYAVGLEAIYYRRPPWQETISRYQT